jgi:antitoxin component YwqK of YwqJK toxin-antitoxin module
MRKIFVIAFLLMNFFALAQDVQLKEGLYYSGKKLYSGVYKQFYKEGKLNIEMNIEKGKLNGEYTVYFESGKKQELRNYEKGLKNGLWCTWNENGIKTAEANYSNDQKDGKWFIWDDNPSISKTKKGSRLKRTTVSTTIHIN